jgi:hypothetical protein
METARSVTPGSSGRPRGFPAVPRRMAFPTVGSGVPTLQEPR